MNLVFTWKRDRAFPHLPPTAHACAPIHTCRLCISCLHQLCCASSGISVLREVGGGSGEGCGGWVVNVCCSLGRSNLACGEVASPLPELWLVCPSSVLW